MGAFDVEPEVGTIFIAQRLDYEQVQRYELRLVASDGKWENQTTVVIDVINQNDEAPIFTQTEYQTSVTEELTDLPVFVLEVSGYAEICRTSNVKPLKVLEVSLKNKSCLLFCFVCFFLRLKQRFKRKILTHYVAHGCILF